ncbi:hypothetical protein NPIL_388091 [Nephila pilipes]|uniref:PiggyBac transposable element-derived protein domain-containing protein n=1 Tax=Nephila pilipes TaxID=299642 RepID=A0A8X6PDT0_NEPPI|nr:hypothetical protein NPIL_388091 [Nephila pilipes]
MKQFLGKCKNATTNNFYTSLNLADKLKSKSTSIVRTMEQSKQEIPDAAKYSKHLLYSTSYYKSIDSTLTAYQCKKKDVLVLNTEHKTDSIIDNEKNEPEKLWYFIIQQNMV